MGEKLVGGKKGPCVYDDSLATQTQLAKVCSPNRVPFPINTRLLKRVQTLLSLGTIYFSPIYSLVDTIFVDILNNKQDIRRANKQANRPLFQPKNHLP